MRDIPGLDLDQYDHVLDTRAEDWLHVRALAETSRVTQKAWRKLRDALNQWDAEDEDFLKVVLPFVLHRTARWPAQLSGYHSAGVVSLEADHRWVKRLGAGEPAAHMLLIRELRDTYLPPDGVLRAVGSPWVANVRRLYLRESSASLPRLRRVLHAARLPALEDLYMDRAPLRTTESLAGIIDALAESGLLAQLVRLDLSRCGLTDADLEGLLAHNPTRLQRLTLYENPAVSLDALFALDDREEGVLPALRKPNNRSDWIDMLPSMQPRRRW